METNNSIIVYNGAENINFFWYFYLSLLSYSFYQYYRIIKNIYLL